jgi:hypothetical protein
MARDKDLNRDERELDEVTDETQIDKDARPGHPNPPRTTAGGWTSPKFGSAGGGGAELEPGPERD